MPLSGLVWLSQAKFPPVDPNPPVELFSLFTSTES